MKCPFCGHEEDRVVDSRTAQDGRAVRRRRECIKCKERFTTYEYIENVVLTVLKSDDRREPFDRAKLLHGIKLACNKRPVSDKRIEAIVNEVEVKLQERSKSEVTSKFIGELVMGQLRNIDEVAYVRFASVYRKFQDKAEFFEELKKLLG
ncbi:MAG: transcriptional regulator NrdR [Candidatus Zixiibacteriota bacterium]|nr:MAG: transcriptional regulator NrdR [candidate division Zixibacteria bacterium]HDL04693.1 transcriptional repressor NrdR [candidate division Zixibacteria bacterium]